MHNLASYLDLSKLNEQPQSESVNESKSLSADHIDELWRRMARIYGVAWVSMFATHDDDTWLRGLSDFTPEDLSIGLEACAKQKPDEDGNLFPPNLPKFRSMCKPKDTRPAYYEIHPELPAPNLTKEEKLKWIEACRKALISPEIG